jgi:hypothetical protein
MPYKNLKDRQAQSRRYYVTHREQIQIVGKRWIKNNPEKHKRFCLQSALRGRRGLPEVEVQKAMAAYDSFDGVCQACGLVCSTQFDVDHDHITHTFRGIVGHRCNIVLGWVKNDVRRLQALIKYLERTNWPTKK